MQRRSSFLLVSLLVLALLAAGCGSDDEQDAVRAATTALTDTGEAAETLEDAIEEAEDALEDALTLELEEQNASGIDGTVELTPSASGEIEVEIELTGSDGGPHPAHIHEGSCDDLDPEPKWPLEDVVDGRSTTTIEVSVGDLLDGEHAVNVHESPENAGTYVACADVRN